MNMNILVAWLAVLFVVYLLYESVEICIQDNRGKGIMRGIRYTLTAVYAFWLLKAGINNLLSEYLGGNLDPDLNWSDIVAASAITIRFLCDLEKRWKNRNGKGHTPALS